MKNRAINFIVKNQLSLAIASIVFLIVLGLFSRVPSIKGDLSGFNIEDLEQYESGVKIADKLILRQTMSKRQRFWSTSEILTAN
jgi:hypothetical protein